MLSDKIGLPVIHLDKDWHNKELWSMDLDKKRLEWRNHVAKLVSQPQWIMDGNYTSSLDIRIPEADLVIFLDYPTTAALRGVVARRLKNRGLNIRTDMPEGWVEKLNKDLIKKVLKFKQTHKPRIMALLKNKPKEQVLIFKNRRQLLEYLEK
jgi:adenylate kinase family enzyme